MQLVINDFLDFLSSTFLVLGGVFVGVPVGSYLIYSGIKVILGSGFHNMQKGFLYSDFGNSPVEVVLGGVLMLAGSLWYLFYDSGGNLFSYPDAVVGYLKKCGLLN